MNSRYPLLAVAFAVVFLSAQLAQSNVALAADQGQSTSASSGLVTFCNSDFYYSVSYNNVEHTSATIIATRTGQCFFGATANFWFQFEVDHTPPNGSSYLWTYAEKNPYTNPGCMNLTSCSFTVSYTTTQPGFYQLTSWAHFSAYPDGSPWQWPTKGFGWTINGSPGPYSPAVQ